MTTIFSTLSLSINESTGLRLTSNGDNFTLPADDLVKLAAIVQMAQANSDSYQDTAVTAAGAEHDSEPSKPAVDWSAAGRKSWETRRRNEAAKRRSKRS